MGLSPSSSKGSGSGSVTSVSSADSSIVVTNPTTTPALQLATLDVIATNEPPAASVPMNGHKLTGLAAGSGNGDSVRYEQLPVGIPANGASGQVVGYGGSAGTGAWAYPPGYELDYVQITAGVTNATGTPVTAITGNAVTYDGATRIKLEVSATSLYVTGASGTSSKLHLFEGSADLGILCQVYDALGSAELDAPAYRAVFFTPSAAAHTYLINLARDDGTGTAGLAAGAGGAGTAYPAWYRITRA